VFWEYTTPNVLVFSGALRPALVDSSVSKKYIARYLLAWFVYQFGVLGHFFLSPSLDNFFIQPGNRISCNNFLETGFLTPAERRIFMALLSALLKGEPLSATKIILAQHYQRLPGQLALPAPWHLAHKKNSPVSRQLNCLLAGVKEGDILVPDSILAAADALQALEKIITALEKEVDFNDGLLSIIQAQLPAIFNLKKNAALADVVKKAIS
ncbi:MAG: hypothetical protein Q8L21_00365, partial [Candidatus Komeilibacteria bacterium]|nr:hypothetical protein [Candidatus Komeilibacteria bacterium]